MLGILVCLTVADSYSQDLQLTKKDSIVKSSYIVGLGYNVVDDSGDVFDGLFKVEDQWNALAYPSRVSIGRYFKNGLGVEAIGAFNKYKVGKFIDGKINTVETNYYSFDTRFSYDLNKLIGETAWFDPYVGVGLGYTDANNTSRGTYNGVVGFRIWLTDHWGLDLNSSGKWELGDKGAKNHLQHAAGVVYQFGIAKGLTKKGEAKLAQILELEQEKQRVQDSIATANRLRDEARLAERLAQEKERSRLAAIAKAEKAEENKNESRLKNSIADLGFVYFDLNSSYLNEASKTILDELANILHTEQSVELKIVSHTDSRGTSTYNEWLSKRRAGRTIAYLESKGIAIERLVGESKGETSLLNECDDTIYCPEEKHKVNRRSEFIITKI